MILKRLYFLLMLGASTAALVGCGGGSGIDAQPQPQQPCQGADASSDDCLPPPPDPCEADPTLPECIADKISISSPAANSLWAKPEMNLIVSFDGSAPADLALTLNGKDVLASATIEDDQAVIKGTDIETLLVHGDNTFEAKAGKEAEKVLFIYDLKAPHIIVTTAVEVETGAVQQNSSDILKVSGIVRDVAPIAAVTINDMPATVTNGEFVVNVPVSDIYRVSATDSNDQSSNISFAAPQHMFDPALALQINNSIFRLLQPIVNDVVANFDSAALLDPAQRIPLGNNEIALTRLDIDKGGEPAIDMHFLPTDSQQLVIEVNVQLPLTGMGLSVYSGTRPAPILNMDMDIADIDVSLQLAVSSDELNQLKLGLASGTPFDLALGNITINQLDILCNGDQQCVSLANAASSLFSNTAFRNALVGMINQNLGPALATALADMEFPNAPLGVPFDLNGDGTRDTLLSIDFMPSLFDTDAQGNGYVEMAGRLYVANDDLPETYKGTLGSVYVDAGPVPAFASTTDSGKEYDLGIALPANFLNQAFLSLYQSGVMSTIGLQIKPSDLGNMGTLLGAVGVDATDDMRMRLVMNAVPYMLLSHDNLAEGRTTGIAMHMDNVYIYMDVKKAGESDFSTLVGMVADITANLELGIDAENYIDLGVQNLVNMDVVSILPVGIGAPGNPLAALMTPAIIESQIGPAVSTLLKVDTIPAMLKKTSEIAITMAESSNVPFQLPLNMGVILREFSVDSSDAYMVLKIDLLSDEEVQNSEENVPIIVNVSKRPDPVPEPEPEPEPEEEVPAE
jgi:hypothetical protein